VARLEGKACLVTGGGTGIGRATALRFAREGASVAVCGRRPGPLADTVGAVRDLGGVAVACHADVSVESGARGAVDFALEAFGRLDVLVNNAGAIRRDLPADRTPVEEWDRLIATNPRSVFLVSKVAIPRMIESGGGAIVNVSSILGLLSGPGFAAYAAAKAGILGLTRSMAFDYGRHGLRVNAVCPGLVHTPMAEAERPDFVERVPEYAAEHPLGRIGRPEDIAAAILFLASEDAAWITGAHLVVDGGYTLE